jgi:hypothetical protein
LQERYFLFSVGFRFWWSIIISNTYL